MYCKYCGKQIDDDSVFCPSCGKEQKRLTVGNENPAVETVAAKAEPDVSPIFPKDSASHLRRNTVAIIALAIVVVLAIAALLIGWLKLNKDQPGKELSAAEIATLSSSVLSLNVYDKYHELISTGSGFVVVDDKTIVTNYHVINQGYFVEAVSEEDVHYNVRGATFFDESADIAVLQFETATGITPIPISDATQVGETVYAIGSPLGLKNTVSNGIISAFRDDGNCTDIQITAPISSGSSGGVLLNVYGKAIGITYASYSDGQNLNLAIPSAEFVDKLQGTEVQSFDNIVLWKRPLGNTIENYSSSEVRLVQYGNTIYESYNSHDNIIAHDVVTKESVDLGIHGTRLSVYQGILYYVAPNGHKVGTYNISTGEICENILQKYPEEVNTGYIHNLYISNHGLTILYYPVGTGQRILQLDFNGAIIGKIDSMSGIDNLTMADENSLVGINQNNDLEIISLPSLERKAIPLDFNPRALCADRDGYLYFSERFNLAGRILKYDLYTGDCTEIQTQAAYSLGPDYCFSTEGNVYYPTRYGIAQISSDGRENPVSKKYQMDNVCFSDDGKLYATGKDMAILGKHLITPQKHTKYYLRMNLDGTNVEILDTKEIDRSNGLS